MPQVAEHRFDGGESSPVAGSACFAVDGPFHPVGVAFFGCIGFTPEESNLPDFRLLRGAQTFVPLLAGQAVALGAAVFGGEVAVVEAVGAVAVELLAGRTDAEAGCRVEVEVFRPVTLGGFFRVRLVVEGIGFGFVFALILEAFVALAHAVVGDQGVDLLFRQGFEVAFVGQTYQTGADTYELFLGWAMLALPWVLAANWRPVWCLWLLLVNVAIALYFGEAWRPMIGSFFAPQSVAVHLAANAGFLLVFEAWAGARVGGSGRSVERFALALSLAAACFLYLIFVFDGRERAWWQPLVALMTFAAAWFAYRRWRIDVAALALWSFGGIIAIVATVAKIMSAGHLETAAFLLTGLTTIGLSALAAGWLRKVHREAEAA